MSETKKDKEKSVVVDVAHPGTTAADSTAKPVIVTNRPMVKDPTLVDEDSHVVPVKIKPSLAKKTDKRLEPLTAPLLEATKAKDASDEVKPAALDAPKEEVDDSASEINSDVAEKAAVTKAEEAEPVTDQEKSQTEPPADQAKSDAEPPTDQAKREPAETDEAAKPETATAEPDTTEPPASQEPAQAEAEAAAKQAEHDAQIQKIVDSKQYYLPVDRVEKRRTRRALLLGILICLLLVIAWLDIALDAGLLKLGGVQPITHFFSG